MKLLSRRPMDLATFLALALISQNALSAADKADNLKTTDAAQKRAEVQEAEPADALLKQVEEAIQITTRRFLSSDVHTPWQIMHGLLALREDYRIKENGKKVSAIQWISQGATYGGEAWFQKTAHGGRAHPYSTAYSFEGHPNQFLAILSMSGLPMKHEFKAANKSTVTIADLVHNAQKEVNTSEEITWTLWALSHYLSPDTRWKNKWGEPWSIERLVQIQTREPVYNAACGGTHGLFAVTYARNMYHLKSKKPLRAVWLEADQKIKRYVAEARMSQNSDGTFSSNYFQGQGRAYDFETRLDTSGHTLEFLMLALPKRRLKEQWVRRAVSAIAKELIDHRRDPADCGSLYHALDSLVIYRDRMLPDRKAAKDAKVAAKEKSARAKYKPAVATHPVDASPQPSVTESAANDQTEK